MPISTLCIGWAVTPTVIRTGIAHYLDRGPRHRKPTAHISYDQGIHLIRQFLIHASHHTVEDLQVFTSQWVPHPTWIRVEAVTIAEELIERAAEILILQLGSHGIREVGGSEWWRWRPKNNTLKAEWVEVKSDYNARQRLGEESRRIMLYIHGGAYFFGSVDEHRYQLQRHARKLNARVFAPRYRLAPQYPFPCGLLDCLAAYLYLLTQHEAAEIILAGDSAGGGMVLSMLCMIRDRELAMPAGAVLISPWVDLTHSFPSLNREDELDYIPHYGFHHRPSRAWPPANADELKDILREMDKLTEHGQMSDFAVQNRVTLTTMIERLSQPLSVQIDGKSVTIPDQVQIYTTNNLLTHPLVSPALQPSLGGLCPLLVMVGDGEVLRDEQIFVAHKAANPKAYPLPSQYRSIYDPDDVLLRKWSVGTPVQLQVWKDLCHVTPTLSFTRPAKFMYRSVSQFSAWALSRAQKRPIVITEDLGETDSDSESDDGKDIVSVVGKAGDPLPKFKDNMIRQSIDRHGLISDLPPNSELPAFQMSNELVGVVKQGPIKKWLTAQVEWERRYDAQYIKTRKWRLDWWRSRWNTYRIWNDSYDVPPPSSLCIRRDDEEVHRYRAMIKKSWGLKMWTMYGAKRDTAKIEQDKGLDSRIEDEELESVGHAGLLNGEHSAVSDTHELGRPSATGRRSSRRATISVTDQGQLDSHLSAVHNVLRTAGSQLDGTAHEGNSAVQHQPAEAALLEVPRVEFGGGSSASSYRGTVHDRVLSDDASTVAIFSAPGVLKDAEADTSQNPPGSEDEGSDSQPSKPITIVISGSQGNDHAHADITGCNTPASRRSIERLQAHQPDMNGAHALAAVDMSTQLASSPPTSDTLNGDDHKSGDSSPTTISLPFTTRNASTTAVVQHPGVVESTQ